MYMKSIYKYIGAGLTLSVLGFANLASAALVVTPATGSTVTEIDVNCTDDAHYYGFYHAGSNKQVTEGECDATNITVSEPGNYNLAVTVADQTGVDYTNLTVAETTVVQITPNFAAAGAPTAITASGYTNFLTGIADFLTAQLPAVLVVLASLIGLGFLIRRVRRWIGKKA